MSCISNCSNVISRPTAKIQHQWGSHPLKYNTLQACVACFQFQSSAHWYSLFLSVRHADWFIGRLPDHSVPQYSLGKKGGGEFTLCWHLLSIQILQWDTAGGNLKHFGICSHFYMMQYELHNMQTCSCCCCCCCSVVFSFNRSQLVDWGWSCANTLLRMFYREHKLKKMAGMIYSTHIFLLQQAGTQSRGSLAVMSSRMLIEIIWTVWFN